MKTVWSYIILELILLQQAEALRGNENKTAEATATSLYSLLSHFTSTTLCLLPYNGTVLYLLQHRTCYRILFVIVCTSQLIDF